MSGIINATEFDQDITEYKMMHKSVVENFLHGVIKLGEILSRQRDKWKLEGKWYVYLKEIGLNEAHAGVQIRTYEYSLKDMKTLLDVNTQNFKQLQKFLKLGDDEKKSLSEEIAGEALPTTEFLEKVERVSEIENPEALLEVQDIEDNNALEVVNTGDLDFSAMLQNSSMVDIPFMAKQLLQALNQQEGLHFSDKCLPIIEAFLHAQQSVNLIKANIDKLDPAEMEFWGNHFQVEADKLKELVRPTKIPF